MSDLSNLLGAVYGSSDPDGPATRHEPSAAERVQTPAPARIDDDLAAALSAALVTSTPDQAVGAPAPVMPAPMASTPAAVTPSFASVTPAPQAAFTPSSYSTGMVSWGHGDDDIFPMSSGKGKKR